MTSWENLNRMRRAHQRGSETIAGDLRQGVGRSSKSSNAELRIVEAAAWLRSNRDRVERSGRHPAAMLQDLFALTSKEASRTLKLAHELDAKEAAT